MTALAIELVTNGPLVPAAVDTLITNATKAVKEAHAQTSS